MEQSTPGNPEEGVPQNNEAQLKTWLEAPSQEIDSESEDEKRGRPVKSFWQKLLHGTGESRVKEVGRSVARGAANFANETVNAGVKLAKAVQGQPDFEDHRITSKESIDQVYGRRSDDPLAAFAEDATQFAAGFAAMGPLGAGTGLAARIGVAAAKGAVVDAVAFDPNDAGLAELAARAPAGYGIREAGEALSVKGDDADVVKRLKRSAAGVVPGVALDALVAGAQRVWAKTVAKTGTAAEKAVAKQLDEKAVKVLSDIADGSHVPEGSFVKVVPNNGTDKGTFRIVSASDEMRVEMPAEGEARDLAQWREEDGPMFLDRAEAEAQAETINFSLNERLNAARQAGGLGQAQAEELRAAFRGLLESGEPLKEGTHFNFSYMNEPQEVLASIESVSKVFKEELDAAQILDGVSIDAQAARLRQLVDGMEPDQAPGLMAAMLEKGSNLPQSVVLGAADIVMRDIALKSSKLFDIVTARPHDVIAWEEARFAVGSLLKLQKALAGAHSEWGRTGRFMQERDALAAAVPLRDAQGPKKAPSIEGKPDAPATAPVKDAGSEVAGMSQREVLAVLKMVKATGGKPSKLVSVHGAATIIQETGFVRRALEFFVNSALSSPVTHATAMTMNTMVSTYEAASKMFAGAVTGNKPLLREGWDTLVANERFVAENLQTAAMAFRQGHSVINPGEVHQAIPGAVGSAVRIPSRGLLFADEFTRVTNYRSIVYAKSLRFWREKGLEGGALAKAVNMDLANAFDKKTGVAVLPDALKYAEVPTMSADLGRETVGGGLASFLNNHVEAKFIAPFVKTSVNIFRYTFDRTPGLNLLAKRNREIIMQGGEGAAVLHTQSAVAAMVGTYAYMQAKSGTITGAGPKEPGLRKLWFANNMKPYSIKIDGEWYSYRRLDPLLTPLSLMADVHDMVQELGKESEADAEDIIAASFAGIAAAFANKSYMVGMTQFFEAWSGGKGETMKRWLQGFATTFTTPQVVRALNDDPYLREVESFKDAMMAGIPGLSDKLPARYNLFGEPELRTHSFMPAPSRGKAEQTVATDLLSLNRGLTPMNRKQINGVPVDLTDGEKFGRVDGLTPYEFAQKMIREPGDGEKGLKDALTEIVKSDSWKDASPGSEQYPGGERFIMAYRVIDTYRRRAIGAMLDKFPEVQREVQLQQAMKGASVSEGQKGALEALREYAR